MQEQILLINFQDEVQLTGIRMAAMLLKIRTKVAGEDAWNMTIGELGGVSETAGTPENVSDSVHGMDDLSVPEKEMMVFQGFSGERLNLFLATMRKKKIRTVDYKAVLTETNKDWTVQQLYLELEREHAEMHKL